MKHGRLSFAVALIALTIGTVFALPGRAAGPNFKKVFMIVMENANYAQAVKQPFLKSLTQRGALLSQYHAVTHPSQPNYIAMVAGDTLGVTNDSAIKLNASHLGDLLEAHGRDWRVYAENYPGNCFLGAQSGPYVRKHVPFISFQNVATQPARCQKIVNANLLARDIQTGHLPDFSFYVPNLMNDGHDTGVAFGDRWLANVIGPLLQNRAFMQDMLVIVTFDESDNEATNQVYTTLYGDSVIAGKTINSAFDHYSILKTLEDAWSLGNLGRHDADAIPLDGMWK